MCNIAGYIGEKEAAPVLLSMMEKEEGFSGGYYTGMATAADGGLWMEKCTGDLAFLKENTRVCSFPGTVGIIHSRSKSGGLDEWAHPFVEGFHNDPTIAYVANGRAGCCVNRMEKTREIVEGLLAEGCRMSSRVKGLSGAYTDLPDGTSVHMSDVMCQMISRNRMNGMSLENAMEAAFAEAPSEVVGLVISKDEPDRIYFARYNYPMFAGFTEHGAYLSSTPLAFPEDVRRILPVPANSKGYVTKEGLYASPFAFSPVSVAEETARVHTAAEEAVVRVLKEGPKPFKELSDLVKPLFEPADCCPSYQLVHQILWDLEKQGKLKQETIRAEGVLPGATAPKIMLSLK